jgi:hypothetical protein
MMLEAMVGLVVLVVLFYLKCGECQSNLMCNDKYREGPETAPPKPPIPPRRNFERQPDGRAADEEWRRYHNRRHS